MINKTAQMKRYSASISDSNKANETNDCTVMSVSIATGMPYPAVHAAFADKGRKARKGAVPRITKEVVQDALGFNMVEITKAAKRRGGLTVRTLARMLPETGTFLIGVANHVLCMRDGVVEDFTNNRWHRVKRVHFIQLTPGEQMGEYRTIQHSTTEGVAEVIRAAAGKLWSLEGKPKSLSVLRHMRLNLMDVLEKQGINRNTASVVLGKWQAAALKAA